jgi:hypothetical protein
MVPKGDAVDEGMEVCDVGVFHFKIVHDKAESYRAGEISFISQNKST